MAYRMLGSASATAAQVYPMLATGLFELPRYLCWPQGRATLGFAALLAIAYSFNRGKDQSSDGGLSR